MVGWARGMRITVAVLVAGCAALAAGSPLQAVENASQIAVLKRQLTALAALQRRHGCVGGQGRGGFFDPCRDLGRETSNVRRMLAALGGEIDPRVPKRRQQAPMRSATSFGGDAPAFCVRLADGYFFPTPNSQFNARQKYADALSQCRFICETAEMAVYVLPSTGTETGEMVSAEGGKRYSELATAHRYRDDAGFRGCNFERYYRTVEGVMFEAEMMQGTDSSDIPLPQSRPALAPSAPRATEVSAGASGDALRKATRVVGPQFYPNDRASPPTGLN